jgi:hypothetical protein
MYVRNHRRDPILTISVAIQVLGFIIRELFYVPVDFRYGILIVSIGSSVMNCLEHSR